MEAKKLYELRLVVAYGQAESETIRYALASDEREVEKKAETVRNEISFRIGKKQDPFNFDETMDVRKEVKVHSIKDISSLLII